MQITPEMLMGTVIGIFGVFIYAVSVVVYKYLGDEIKPLAAASIKMWVALGLMAVIVLLPIRESPFIMPADSLIFLILSVIFGAVVGDTIYLVSQERIGVSYAFPISMSFPIYTYLLAIVLLGESLLPFRLFGAILAVVGVIIITREQNKGNEASDANEIDLIGILLAFATALLYACGGILAQIGVANVDPIDANLVRVLFGSIAFIPIAGFAKYRGMPNPTRRAIRIAAIAGFFGMGLGSLLYITTIQIVGAAIASVFAAMAPIFAIPISMVVLDEHITRTAGLGVITTIIGVILVILGV